MSFLKPMFGSLRYYSIQPERMSSHSRLLSLVDAHNLVLGISTGIGFHLPNHPSSHQIELVIDNPPNLITLLLLAGEGGYVIVMTAFCISTHRTMNGAPECLMATSS